MSHTMYGCWVVCVFGAAISGKVASARYDLMGASDWGWPIGRGVAREENCSGGGGLRCSHNSAMQYRVYNAL